MDVAEADQFFMAHALRLAQQAFDAGEVPVGAVVVLGDEVVGEGWNQPIAAHDMTAHAEILALRQAAQILANYRLPEARLYVTLEPCTMCVGAMVHARIRELIFAACEPKAGMVVSRSHLLSSPWFNHQVDVRYGVLAQESSQLLQQFFQQRRAAQRRSAADDRI